MGLSVIAVIEILEFAVEFILAICRKLHICRTQEIKPTKPIVVAEKY
jgi:hypothetical protein